MSSAQQEFERLKGLQNKKPTQKEIVQQAFGKTPSEMVKSSPQNILFNGERPNVQKTIQPVKQVFGRRNKEDFEIESNINDIEKIRSAYIPKLKKPTLDLSRERISYLTDPNRKLTSAEQSEARNIVSQLRKDARKRVLVLKRTPEDHQRAEDIADLEVKYSKALQFEYGRISSFGGEAAAKNAEEKLSPEVKAALKERLHPESEAINTYQSARTQNIGAFTTGQIAGEGIKYAGAAKAISAIPKVGALVNSGSGAKNLATRVATASTVDLPMDIINAAQYSNGDKGEFGKQLGLNVGLGVGAGTAIEGIAKGARALKESGVKLPQFKAPQLPIFKNAGQNLPDAAKASDNVNAATLPDVKEPTLPNMKTNPQAMPNIKQETQAAAPQPEFGRNTVGSAQSAYPRNQKVSKFRTNTIEKTSMLTAEEKERYLKPEDYLYDKISEKQSVETANERLQVDFDGEVKDLKHKEDFTGEDVDTSMGIANKYIDDARKSGDPNAWSIVNEWTKLAQEKGTQGGQLVQAFHKYSRTPIGAVVKGHQVVASAMRDIEKRLPGKIKEVEAEAKQISDIVDQSGKEAATESAQLLPEEMLAKRIAATTKTPKQKENAIQDMVNELFRSAKESPLPDKAKIKQSPVDALKKAIDNKEQYADNPEVSAMLDDYFEKGIVPTYSQKTLTGSIKEASESVGADLNQVIKQSKGDKDKLRQDITDYLTTRTGASGEEARLLSEQIAKRYDEILKEKTESMLKQMFAERPKITNKSTKEKVMELIHMGAYDSEDFRNMIMQKNGIPVLTNEDTKNILEYMTEAQKHTEGSYERKMWQSRAEQIIADKEPSTFREQFRGVQRIMMLSNPRTLLTRNPLGNVILGAGEIAKDIPGTLIDKAVSLKTGERKTGLSFEVLRARAEGAKQGLSEWGKDIKNKVDTSPTRGQAELPNKRIFKGNVLNGMDQFVRKSLQLGDRLFYQGAFNGRMAELKQFGVVGEEAEAQAKLYALDQTFQNNSALAQGATKLRESMNQMAGGFPAGDLIIPFTQTPANVMDKLLDYSPVGFGKAMSQLGKGAKGFDQKLFVDRLSRSFTGTGLIILGGVMAANGLAKGDLGKNKDVRAAQYAEGQQPFALKIGDSYYSFDWAQPIGGLLSIGANAYQASKDTNDFISIIGAGAEAGANTVFKQQFLSGIFSMLSGQSPAESISKTILGASSQFTPAGISSLAKVVDPNVRETYDPNFLAQQGKKLAARIPGLSMTLPKKLDELGEPVMQSQGRNMAARAFENFLSPGKLTTLQHADVYPELNRLYKQTGSVGVFPNVAEKNFEVKGEKVILSAKDYETYSKAQGEIVRDNISNLIQSKGYAGMSDEQKADAVSSLYDYARSIAKTKVSNYELDESKQKAKAAIEKGVKPAEYYIAYAAQKNVEGDKDSNGNTIKGTENPKKRAAIDAVTKGMRFDKKDIIYKALGAGLSETAEKTWAIPEVQKAVGSKENYYKIQELLSTIKADKDEYGNSISGTAKEKELSAISKELNVSPQKANDIYTKAVTFKYDIKEFSSKDQAAFAEFKKRGMSEQDYVKWRNIARTAQGVKNSKGYTVRGSLSADTYRRLVQAGMSPAQARYFIQVNFSKKKK